MGYYNDENVIIKNMRVITDNTYCSECKGEKFKFVNTFIDDNYIFLKYKCDECDIEFNSQNSPHLRFRFPLKGNRSYIKETYMDTCGLYPCDCGSNKWKFVDNKTCEYKGNLYYTEVYKCGNCDDIFDISEGFNTPYFPISKYITDWYDRMDKYNRKKRTLRDIEGLYMTGH